MHERSTERRSKPPARTVEEAMIKHDAEVDIATSALRAATQDVTDCIAELMNFIAPSGASNASRGSFTDRNIPFKPFGLAGEIHDVTCQLRALQRAAELATRRARRRLAREGDIRFPPASPQQHY
jgi:hypothetical protein